MLSPRRRQHGWLIEHVAKNIILVAVLML